MLILFDFRCGECGTVHEALVDREQKHTKCTNCGSISTRMVSPVRSQLEGITGHFPDAADKWARQHEKAGKESPT